MIWRCWTRTKVCSPNDGATIAGRTGRKELIRSRLGSAGRIRSGGPERRRRWTGAGPRAGRSLHVERLGPGRLAGGVGGDLVDAGLGLAQQLLAAALQGFAAFIDGDRLLQRHLAFLEPLDDRFQFLDRALEGERLHIHLVVLGHLRFPKAPAWA